MRTPKQLLLVIACVLAGFALLALAQPAKQAQARLSILFEPNRGYEVDGKTVPANKLEGVLRENIRAKSEHAKVTVLLHLNSRIADLYFLRGLLQAIGFVDIRFFWFTDDREKMVEILVDRPAIPFTVGPPN